MIFSAFKDNFQLNQWYSIESVIFKSDHSMNGMINEVIIFEIIIIQVKKKWFIVNMIDNDANYFYDLMYENMWKQ